MPYDPRDGNPGVDRIAAQAAGWIPLDIGFLSGDRALYGRGGLLMGWSVREANGTPGLCQVEWRDGSTATNRMLGAVAMAASGEDQVQIGWPGVRFQSGIFGHVVSGAAVGALWIMPDA